MKAEHILLLVLAGALGGAGLMKLVQKPQPAAVAVKPASPAVPSLLPAPPVAVPAVPAAPAPDPAPPKTVPPAPQPAPKARPHVRVARPLPSRMPAFAVKPSPFAPPRPTPVEAQVQPAPASPPIEVPKAQPQPETQVLPSLPPALPPARVEPEPVPVTLAPPPPPPTVTLNAGTLIPVRLVDGLSSERNAPGDTFAATLDHELVADGFVIAERGARVQGRVLATSHGGRARGDAELVIELTRLNTSDGQRIAILTDSFHKQMEPNRSQDAGTIAGGAVIGAAIGAIAAGGKGSAVGAGVGGGAGVGEVLLTRKPAALPSETRLSFRLNAPVTLTERQ